ncbi:MAG: glycosyltransferase family 4 protein [Chitinispirillaceae bacterium]|jgi:glycosyltransferase involved in cell wall biosynthesis|nr:glycosyltransferase family 4 protein [Chitinispirillaceae bacterium]
MSGPRLLFINHWASRLGGAEHSLLDILEEAAHRNDADVHLVTAEEGELVERARALGVKTAVFRCDASLDTLKRGSITFTALLRRLPAIVSFIRYALAVRSYVASVKPGLIHANVPKAHMTLFLLVLLGYRGRCCYHVREIFDAGSVPWRIYGMMPAKRRSAVLAISNAARDSLPKRIHAITRVVYNGVEVRHKLDRSEYDGPVRFIYLGRVVPWKGCHLIIEAFSKIAARPGSCRAGTLDIVGDTLYWDQAYRKTLEDLMVRSGCSGACRLLPHTHEPLTILRDHDVFCIASDREPFGRVVAEAQGCGLPVVAFASGGIPEIVNHDATGILVAPGDVAAFAAAMEQFIDKPALLGEMGRAAHERALRYFNRDVQIKAIVDILVGK